MSNTFDDSVEKFYTSFYINASIGGVALVIFCLIHQRRIFGFSNFFAPRKKGNDNALSVQFWTGLVIWIWESLSYPDKQLLRTHGADALTYVRFLRMCFISSLVMGIMSCSIILPLNLSGDNESDALGDLGKLTMSHLDERDSKLGAHVVITWVYSVFFYFILYYYYRLYVGVRRHWLNHNTPRSYTILLLNLPKRMLYKQAIKSWFEDHFRTKVCNVILLWNDKKLLKLKAKRAKCINQLELAKLNCAKLAKKKAKSFYCCGTCGRRIKKKGKLCACCCNSLTGIGRCFSSCFGFFERIVRKYLCCCCCTFYETDADRRLTHDGFLNIFGEKVDAVTYYRERVAELTQQIREMKHYKKDRMKKTGAAFVTFNKVYPARVKISPFVNPTKMVVWPAPDPADVHWRAFYVSYPSQIIRMFLITAVMIAICLSWGFASLLITSISNLNNISAIDGFGWINDFLDIFPSQIQSIIQGYLPPVILYLVTLLMKPVIKFFYARSGWLYAHSDVEWWTMSTYTVFLFFNVFLVSTIGTTLFTVLADFIDNPTSIVTLLATALPQQSLFFITFLMAAGAGRIPIKLFRPANLLGVLFKYIFSFPRTPRAKRAFQHLELWFDYAGEVGQALTILTLVLVYSIMAPLITPFGVFYFFLNYIVTRYNLIYANMTPWDSGGRLWPKIFHHATSSVLVFQLVMLGIFGLNSNYQSGMWALVPLPVITIFYWVGIHFMWSPVSAFGPVTGTFTIEQDFLDKSLLERAYEQPSFKDPEEEMIEEDIEGYESEDDEEKGGRLKEGDDDVEDKGEEKKQGEKSDDTESSTDRESAGEASARGEEVGDSLEMREIKQSKRERERKNTALLVEKEMERRRRRRKGEVDDDEEGSESEEDMNDKRREASAGDPAKKKAGTTPQDTHALMQKINAAYEKRFERDMREFEWERKKERRREGHD